MWHRVKKVLIHILSSVHTISVSKCLLRDIVSKAIDVVLMDVLRHLFIPLFNSLKRKIINLLEIVVGVGII